MDRPVPASPTASPPLGNPFEQACERCGTFAPLSSKYGPALCAECIERTAHPIVQTPSGVGDLVRGVFQLARAIGLPGAVVVTLAGLPMSLIEFAVPGIPFVVSNLWGFIVGTAAEMVVLHLSWQAITSREQRASTGAALSAVGRRFGALLGTRFISNLVTLLFSLLLIVPGVMKAMSLAIAMPITLHEGSDASSAMASSTARMRGHRMEAFLAFCVTGAPLFLLIVAIFCVAAAQGAAQQLGSPTAPVAASAFYDYAMLALGILTPAALLPMTLVPAVLYAKLPQPEYGGTF